MRIAIHQPNYFPWLGYFYKIYASESFVFLDDVQYTKNGYINRTQVQNGDKNRWMTIPVFVHLGDPIDGVMPAKDSWNRSHIDLLANSYRGAAHFKTVMPQIEEILKSVPQGTLSDINRHIILKVAVMLEIDRQFVVSSELNIQSNNATDRLIKIVQSISPDAIYLSGRGGANYQDEEMYKTAGIGFEYTDFKHPVYDQGGTEFAPGRSILDAFFHLGVEGTRAIWQGNS